MQRRTLTLLLFIFVVAGCATYIDWPNNPGLHIGWLGIHHPLEAKLGLDLQGGVRDNSAAGCPGEYVYCHRCYTYVPESAGADRRYESSSPVRASCRFP